MQLFYIPDVKGLMNALLKEDIFDTYEARGVVLQTFTRFDISCATESSRENLKAKYCLWHEIKPIALSLIKGKTPPRFIKISLCLSDKEAESIVPNAAALHMTITYENGKISVLTGSSQKSFSLDKLVDGEWDRISINMFHEHGFETVETLDAEI